MDIPTIVNIVLSILSFALCVVSVWTAVKTLKQNKELIQQNYDMLESSTRPYIGIYTSNSYAGEKPKFLIILKNFGQSSAMIKEFSSDVDLSKFSKIPGYRAPFSGLCGSTIMPGQSFRTVIDYDKAIKENEIIEFTIKYSSPVKDYFETIFLKLNSNSGNITEHSRTPGNELLEISSTLQEMHLTSL